MNMKEGRIQARVNICVNSELWAEFQKKCKDICVSRSEYLRMCMQAFIDIDKKPITEILEKTMIEALGKDKDFLKDLQKAIEKQKEENET